MVNRADDEDRRWHLAPLPRIRAGCTAELDLDVPWRRDALVRRESAMRTALVLGVVVCVAPLLIGGVVSAGPGDRLERHPQLVCTECTDSDVSPVTAADAAGNSVVVWTKISSEFIPDAGLWGRLYAPDGSPRGQQFRVSPTTEGRLDPFFSVAMSPSGRFVVVWLTYFASPEPGVVHARRFDADGTPLGTVITITDPSHGVVATKPKVAMDDDGDFVVVWATVDLTTTNFSVFARLYSAAGVPQSAEVAVDSNGVSPRYRDPDVAMDDDGAFVVVWAQGQARAPGGEAVFARRYDAAGVAQGGRFPVSTADEPGVAYATAAVAMAAGGRFTVVFPRVIRDADGVPVASVGIFGRRFDAAGAPMGGEYRVSQVGRSLSHWNCSELARQLKADGIVQSISSETIRCILQSRHPQAMAIPFVALTESASRSAVCPASKASG